MSNSQASAPAATIGEVDGDPRPAVVRAGTARAGVREPRTRIVAAMIELVGEQGYASTSVADVIARARASRRTFYEYFANNQACFMDAAEDVATRWLDRVALAVDRAAAASEDQVVAFVEGIFQATLASPSELRLLAAELPAAQEAGLELRRFAFAELGHTLSQALGTRSASGASNSKRAGAPDASLIPRVLAGAIVRVAYARVLRGGRASKPARGKQLALSAGVADWAATYASAPVPRIARSQGPPPIGGRAPGTLSLSTRADGRRGLPRGEGAVSRSFVVHNQRERLLDAVANLSAAKGYGAVTIPEIVQEAAVSVEAFYEHFTGREDAMLVAYELGRRKLLAVVEQAYHSQERWPLAVRAGIETLLAFLASEPSFTRLALLEVPAGGGKLAAHAQEGPLIGLLRGGLDLSARTRRLPDVAIEASANALRELCYEYAAAGRSQELTSLVDVATHIALSPFAAAGVRGC